MTRFLASASTRDATLVGGTREALHVGELVLPWERVRSATWDMETSTLTVTAERVLRLAIADPGRLLELVRERVSASVVLQRTFPGGRVLARRALGGAREVTWQVEYDDPSPAPRVRADADAALAAAQAELG